MPAMFPGSDADASVLKTNLSVSVPLVPLSLRTNRGSTGLRKKSVRS